MTRKRKAPDNCPLCGCKAHLAEVVMASRNQTRYTVLCAADNCRLSEPPPFRLCQKTEDNAVDIWNWRP